MAYTSFDVQSTVPAWDLTPCEQVAALAGMVDAEITQPVTEARLALARLIGESIVAAAQSLDKYHGSLAMGQALTQVAVQIKAGRSAVTTADVAQLVVPGAIAKYTEFARKLFSHGQDLTKGDVLRWLGSSAPTTLDQELRVMQACLGDAGIADSPRQGDANEDTLQQQAVAAKERLTAVYTYWDWLLLARRVTAVVKQLDLESRPSRTASCLGVVCMHFKQAMDTEAHDTLKLGTIQHHVGELQRCHEAATGSVASHDIDSTAARTSLLELLDVIMEYHEVFTFLSAIAGNDLNAVCEATTPTEQSTERGDTTSTPSLASQREQAVVAFESLGVHLRPVCHQAGGHQLSCDDFMTAAAQRAVQYSKHPSGSNSMAGLKSTFALAQGLLPTMRRAVETLVNDDARTQRLRKATLEDGRMSLVARDGEVTATLTIPAEDVMATGGPTAVSAACAVPEGQDQQHVLVNQGIWDLEVRGSFATGVADSGDPSSDVNRFQRLMRLFRRTVHVLEDLQAVGHVDYM